jgi:hypothetical protein
MITPSLQGNNFSRFQISGVRGQVSEVRGQTTEDR